MKTRVKLTIEKTVLNDSKLYAKKNGISVSEMVEDYSKIVTRQVKRKTILDFVEKLKPANPYSNIDLKEPYYQARAIKYGF